MAGRDSDTVLQPKYCEGYGGQIVPQKTFCYFICESRHHGNFSNRLISNVKICSENYVII